MQNEHPLLSDYLEELKTFKDGVFLDKTISLNPDYEDDYSERVHIDTAKLKDIDTTKFKSYKVLWCDQTVLNPNFVEICVRKI